jgi:ferredoxin
MRQHCSTCQQRLEEETIGGKPGVVVGYCLHCDVIVMPGSEAHPPPPEYPRCSGDR